MNSSDLENVTIKNQVCFPLYACSKEVIRMYKTYLDRMDLTYTQYIAMMVIWEKNQLNVKELGKELFLDSGTLTPVLKKLESKGYITRIRSKEDERNLIVSITEKGNTLRKEAAEIPHEIAKYINLEPEESETLYHLLYKLLENFVAK